MERGYVKLWRKTQDSGLMQNHIALALFCHLLFNASLKGRSFTSGGSTIALNPGVAIFSRIRVARELNISEQQARTALKFLEKLEIVTTKSTNKFTLVYFVNWGVYQQTDSDNQPTNQPRDNQQLTNNQPTLNQEITTALRKKEYNIKNTSYSLSEKVSDETPKQASLLGEELPVEEKPRKKSPVPNCPQEKIIELYHECLPELAQVRAWSANNATNMRARWRDRWAEKKYSTVEEGIAYWKNVFTFVHDHCPWLMGRNDREWKMDLAWFMKASNFTKFLNRKYDDNRAA